MKRDLDLIRHILIAIENSDSRDLSVEDFEIEQYTPEQISQHVVLLLDVGYIEAIETTTLDQRYSDFLIQRITMSGYDYLDSVRDNKVWTETKSKLKQLAITAPLDVVKTIASQIIIGMLA